MTKRPVYAVDTSVPVSRTKSEIEENLSRFGATSFAFATHPDRAIVMFEYNARRVRFDLPLPTAGTEAQIARQHRQRWRALLLSIKAKIVSVQTEIETFEEAFLAHVVLADGRKVSDTVLPAIEHQYKTGQFIPLLEGPK